MRAVILFGFASCIGALALAADDRPDPFGRLKSGPAVTAVAAHRAAVGKARKEYEAKLVAADRVLAAELEAAQAEATKRNDLDEAVALRDARKSLAAGSSRPVGRPKLIVGEVFAGGGRFTRGGAGRPAGEHTITLAVTDVSGDRVRAVARFEVVGGKADKPTLNDLDGRVTGDTFTARDQWGASYELTLRDGPLPLKWTGSKNEVAMEFVVHPNAVR